MIYAISGDTVHIDDEEYYYHSKPDTKHGQWISEQCTRYTQSVFTIIHDSSLQHCPAK